MPDDPQSASPPLAPVSETRPAQWTRRDCTIFGAKVFAETMAAAMVVAFLPLLARILAEQPSLCVHHLKVLLVALAVAVPPAWVIGALVGFELYRLVVGSRTPSEFGFWSWAILFLFVFG